MKGLIIINAFSGIGKSQAERLKTEFDILGVKTDTVNNINVRANGYDFGVFLDKDIYTAERLQNGGLRLFNTAKTIAVCDDKALTTLALEKHCVPTPKTLFGAFCYTQNAKVMRQEIDTAIAELGLPLVFKLNKSSLGAGVFLADTAEKLESLIIEYRTLPHLYQKYIAESAGRDIRVIVIGGRAVAAMERVNKNDFRSNIASGGTAKPFALTEEVANIAVRASEAVGSDYCGVDILQCADGSSTVCEVNSNAFFAGIEAVTGINIARLYAEHIIESLKQ